LYGALAFARRLRSFILRLLDGATTERILGLEPRPFLAGAPGQQFICNALTAACKSAFFILLWFNRCRLNWTMAFFKLATVAFSTVDVISLYIKKLDFNF